MYTSDAYEENYSLSIMEFDEDQRKVYTDNAQRENYQDAYYIILAYPYQTYAWRTDTFSGWGDWDEDPGRSLDAFWTGNPLYFDLVPDEVQPRDDPPYLLIAAVVGAIVAIVAITMVLKKKGGGKKKIEDADSPLGE